MNSFCRMTLPWMNMEWLLLFCHWLLHSVANCALVSYSLPTPAYRYTRCSQNLNMYHVLVKKSVHFY